jgi:single-strand DNA-binding protein
MGRDADFKHLDNGTAVASFSIAVTRPFKDRKTDKYEADWFEIEVFGKPAEFVANHCGKGRLVAVTGAHRCRKYQDQQGNNRVAWEVKADSVQGVGPAPENSGAPRTEDNSGGAYDDPFGQE